jgi:hypothetical protein
MFLTTPASAVEFVIVIHKDVVASTFKFKKQATELFVTKKS